MYVCVRRCDSLSVFVQAFLPVCNCPGAVEIALDLLREAEQDLITEESIDAVPMMLAAVVLAEGYGVPQFVKKEMRRKGKREEEKEKKMMKEERRSKIKEEKYIKKALVSSNNSSSF